MVNLVQEFHRFIFNLHADGAWVEHFERSNCPSCKYSPVSPVITSCKHMYCEDFFYGLKTETPEADKPACVTCGVIIQGAALCGSLDDIQIDLLELVLASRKKAQQMKIQKAKRKKLGRLGMFLSGGINAERDEMTTGPDEDEDEYDFELEDWIPEVGAGMPGAKLTKTRDIIADWIAKTPNIKVVVFTQYLDFIRIFTADCEREKWKYVCVSPA